MPRTELHVPMFTLQPGLMLTSIYPLTYIVNIYSFFCPKIIPRDSGAFQMYQHYYYYLLIVLESLK